MDRPRDFLECLESIKNEKESYVIFLDHDVIHVSKKDDEDGDSWSFDTSPINALWEMLEKLGYNVDEA